MVKIGKRRVGKVGPKVDPLPTIQVAALLDEAARHRVAADYDKAIPIYESLERTNPLLPDAPLFLALIDLARGRPAPALERLDPLTRRAADQALVWFAYAHALRELGRWTEAIKASRRALELDPNDTAEQFALANALEVSGDMQAALSVLGKLAANPSRRLGALMNIARISPSSIGPAEFGELSNAAHDELTDAEMRSALYFALGPLLERQGKYDDAFMAFATAARLKRQILTGERVTHQRAPVSPAVRAVHPADVEKACVEEVAFMTSLFTRDFIVEQEGQGSHLRTPIFVVGMPRSGSTLIEQILSSHAKVQGLGETSTLPNTVDAEFPLKFLAPYGPGHYRKLADAYLAAMHDRGWTTSARFIDKWLGNYSYIGVIHLVFPRAVILHAVRDPVDTCLSIFRQHFMTGNEMSYDLSEIGREYVLYREMMAHWDQVLPGRVIDVDHEALVADPEGRIRWLVTEACGLTWDPACLEFHKTKRPVRTASVQQVRQPIFKSSVQRWRKYEKHLGPLLEALGPYAPPRH